MLDPFVVILYLCNTYIISLFKKLYILLLCLYVLINIIVSLKKEKRKKAHLALGLLFVLSPIFCIGPH